MTIGAVIATFTGVYALIGVVFLVWWLRQPVKRRSRHG